MLLPFIVAAVSAAQLPIRLANEPSFVDGIFGELVDTPESRSFKAQAQLQSPLKESIGISQEKEFQSWLELQDHQQKLHRHATHSGYMRLKPKYNLPSDDDTSDLEDRNLFGGIVTFAGLPTFNCFSHENRDKPIDIAIVGAPFDTGTSYRPGARFGPESIRLGARRLPGGSTPVRGNTKDSPLNKINPYDPRNNLTLVDCGDVPMTPFDNTIALNQLYRGQRAIHAHPVSRESTEKKTGHKAPRTITLGGDHTITLLNLRSVYDTYGPVAVLHFDSHIDTWDPKVLGGGITDYMSLNHGTFLHYAAEQGYIIKDKNFHVGLRAPYIDKSDADHDKHFCGFNTITARDLDTFGRDALVKRIKDTVGDLPVYISLDIDVLDPANAPGTGTMEIGGWTGRELLSFLDSLVGINLVGADLVEVSPPYDTNAEITSLAATAVVDTFLSLMVLDINSD